MAQLFLDLDGVMADFDTGYFNLTGIRPSKVSDDVDWNLIRATPNFYRDLPPMPDFWVLWEGVWACVPIVLTGVPRSVPEAYDNKRAWVDRHLGRAVEMIGCPSKDKSLHMKAPGDILVDDWEKYKDLWVARGGRWVTHTSAASSLEQLSKLLR